MNIDNKKTILKLYDTFMDDIYTMTSKKYKLSKQLSDLEDSLNKTLTDEQRNLLDKINHLETEKNEETYKQVFVYAYSLATKLIVEGLDQNKS